MLFYVGKRPVVKERFLGEEVNPWTGEAGKYSNYQIHNTASVLDGAPNTIHVPEEYDKQTPLDRAGEYPRAFGYDFKYLEHHGVIGDAPLRGSFGHEIKAKPHELHETKVDPSPLVDSFGHDLRAEGGAATFGRFDPFNYSSKAVGDENALENDAVGHALPADNTGILGHNKIKQWNGVESDRAIF